MYAQYGVPDGVKNGPCGPRRSEKGHTIINCLWTWTQSNTRVVRSCVSVYVRPIARLTRRLWAD